MVFGSETISTTAHWAIIWASSSPLNECPFEILREGKLFQTELGLGVWTGLALLETTKQNNPKSEVR
jgi:hypothetical protein